MIHPGSMEIVLIDLYGVRVDSGRGADPEQLLQIFWEFSDGLTAAEIAGWIRQCTGDPSLQKAEECWQKIYRKKMEHIAHEWPKRERQILSGNSKFCRSVKNDADSSSSLILRNTFWFAARDLKPEQLRMESYPHGEAEKIWLTSFRQQLEHVQKSPLPLIWRQNPDGMDQLYFDR